MKSVQTLCHFVKIVETVWKNIMINLTFTSTCLYTSYYIITVNPDFSEVFPLQSEYAPRSLISGNLRTQYVTFQRPYIKL